MNHSSDVKLRPLTQRGAAPALPQSHLGAALQGCPVKSPLTHYAMFFSMLNVCRMQKDDMWETRTTPPEEAA